MVALKFRTGGSEPSGIIREEWYIGVGAVAKSGQTTASPAKRYAVTTTLPMIESGDVGKAVEVWQKIVGVDADGE